LEGPQLQNQQLRQGKSSGLSHKSQGNGKQAVQRPGDQKEFRGKHKKKIRKLEHPEVSFWLDL
jgi:hypothetical protein